MHFRPGRLVSLSPATSKAWAVFVGEGWFLAEPPEDAKKISLFALPVITWAIYEPFEPALEVAIPIESSVVGIVHQLDEPMSSPEVAEASELFLGYSSADPPTRWEQWQEQAYNRIVRDWERRRNKQP